MPASPGQRRTIAELLETHNKAAIARKLGVDSTTVSRWARGDAIPAGDKLVALAQLLGVDAASINLTPSKAVA